ncbi:hypothetical protein [Streptomyces sp. NPDC015125]
MVPSLFVVVGSVAGSAGTAVVVAVGHGRGGGDRGARPASRTGQG